MILCVGCENVVEAVGIGHDNGNAIFILTARGNYSRLQSVTYYRFDILLVALQRVKLYAIHLNKYSKLASWWPIWLLLSARVVLSRHIKVCVHAFRPKFGFI
jgi:carbon starvation protein CstA